MPIDTTHEHLGGTNKWTIETALAHLIALNAANDRRYEQRFEASQKALELGLTAQKSAIDHASTASQRALDVAVTNTKDAFDSALASIERAVLKAEVATEKRFESVNEFRSTLDDQQRTLIPRAEVDVMVKGLEEKIGNLGKLMDELRARERASDSAQRGVKDGWGAAVGVVGFVITVGMLLFNLLTPRTEKPTPSPQIIYAPAPPGSLLPTTPPAAVPR